jgi:proline iminopeptidase
MNATLAVLRRLVGMALLPLAVVAAVLMACIGFFGASSLTDSLLLASCASLLLAFAFGSALAWKGFHLAGTPSPHHWGARIGFAITAAVALLAALHLFKPLELPSRHSVPRADTRYWSLDTGSFIAYTHFPASGAERGETIVFLHGGPGAPLRESEYAFFERFAGEGYDVYLYEQVGTGRSAPPADVRDYSVRRNVNDLEAIRRQIGAERLILVGQSWGAALAANYVAAHPDRVAKLILPSPGPMTNTAAVRPNGQMTAAAGPVEAPLRVQVAQWLAEINPRIAIRFAPPEEMNRYASSIAPQILRLSYCAADAGSVPSLEGGGFNFYANWLTQYDLNSRPDLRPALMASGVPALVMKGECDYVPWFVSYDYARSLPNARMVLLRRTGHLLWAGQPEQSFHVMLAFLQDRPMPAEYIL